MKKRERAAPASSPAYHATAELLGDGIKIHPDAWTNCNKCRCSSGRTDCTLLIEAEREIAGRMDAATELQLTDCSIRKWTTDDLGELVLSKGGKVLVVPSERMPTKTGAAGTCRF